MMRFFRKVIDFLSFWVIPVVGGLAVMFLLAFSLAWGFSYAVLDCVFAPMLSAMEIPFDVTSNGFRFAFCSLVAVLSIIDRLREWTRDAKW